MDSNRGFASANFLTLIHAVANARLPPFATKPFPPNCKSSPIGCRIKLGGIAGAGAKRIERRLPSALHLTDHYRVSQNAEYGGYRGSFPCPSSEPSGQGRPSGEQENTRMRPGFETKSPQTPNLQSPS
jgi:hypothetical protein